MKKAKKFMRIALAALLAVASLAGCGAKTEGFDGSQEIGVISRESGSGTRGAFVELFGIEEKDENGNSIDRTVQTAVTTSATSVMITTVSGDLYSIGYTSLGSLNNSVKALKIDGVAPSIETIKDSSYQIARPFNIVTRSEISPEAQDFIDFILSADGQRVIEDNGYIAGSDAPAYSGAASSGKIKVEGSSSVTPVMEKLKEAYVAKNPGVTVEIQQDDSSTGITSTIDGSCDIGMASRDLKDSEIQKGAAATVIAMDGIVVIVNNDCPLDGLSSSQVKDIFTGGITTWSEVVGG